ncbi:unannotated protein [freshwater metagenome]|uniref:Unannotated protein n=1 Tax=freshwater metagenome TaxID=449393 RepID=A0A6J6QHG9_9ZZZZ
MTKKSSPIVGRSRDQAVTEADIELMNAEAEVGYDVTVAKSRGGRPTIGSGPATVVPVRLDPELRAALDARASADHRTASEVIREALRQFLHTA